MSAPSSGFESANHQPKKDQTMSAQRINITIPETLLDWARATMDVRNFDEFSGYLQQLIREDYERRSTKWLAGLIEGSKWDRDTTSALKALAVALGISTEKGLLLTGKASEFRGLSKGVQNGAGGVAGPVNPNDSEVVPGVVGGEVGKGVGAGVSKGKVAAILLDELLQGCDVRHQWSHHGDPRYEQAAKLIGASKRVVHRVVVVHDRKDLSTDDEESADVVIAGGKVIKNRNGPFGWSVERIYQGVEGAL